MNGKLFGIGTGPGDSELLTIKALETIKNTQNLVFPNKDAEKCRSYETIRDRITGINEKNLIFLDFPMTNQREILEEAQKKAAEKISGYMKAGQDVAFLTIGDPTVYSTYIYVQNYVEEMGFSTEIINGVPSFCAVAAKLGISLSCQDEEIHIIPGNYDIKDSFSLKGTLIFMKSGKKLKELVQFLDSAKASYNFEFYAVSNCSLKDEIQYRRLEDFKPSTGYLTVIIIKNIKPKTAVIESKSAVVEPVETTTSAYSFFQNTSCEMFPCHKFQNSQDFNCLFCYCPLYFLGDKCGGNFVYNQNGKKSCINCDFPHQRENYKLVNAKLKESGISQK